MRVGRFGRPNMPIDGAVLDRIMSLPRTREILAEAGMAPLPELRQRIGARLSDEEFLLRATMPAGLVDAMQAAGPANRDYKPYTRPVLELIRGLCRQREPG